MHLVLAQVIAPTQPQRIKLQSSGVLRACQVAGNPPPSVAWLKNGRPLDKSRVAYVPLQNLIVIKNVARQDSGTYTCNVSQVFEKSQLIFTAHFEVYATEPGILCSYSLRIEKHND